MKVIWISRHAMTPDQQEDLKRFLGAEDLEVAAKNITWSASADAKKDYEENVATLRDMLHQDRPDILAGVFPPVALEALDRFRDKDCTWAKERFSETLEPEYEKGVLARSVKLLFRVVTPVSIQDPAKRIGEGPIPFSHARWLDIR